VCEPISITMPVVQLSEIQFIVWIEVGVSEIWDPAILPILTPDASSAENSSMGKLAVHGTINLSGHPFALPNLPIRNLILPTSKLTHNSISSRCIIFDTNNSVPRHVGLFGRPCRFVVSARAETSPDRSGPFVGEVSGEAIRDLHEAMLEPVLFLRF
jgi:hypothetical protein